MFFINWLMDKEDFIPSVNSIIKDRYVLYEKLYALPLYSQQILYWNKLNLLINNLWSTYKSMQQTSNSTQNLNNLITRPQADVNDNETIVKIQHLTIKVWSQQEWQIKRMASYKNWCV